MTVQSIKRAIRDLHKEHEPSAQRNHTEGVLNAALQCAQKMEKMKHENIR